MPPIQVARPLCLAVDATHRSGDAFRPWVEYPGGGASSATLIVAIATQLLLLRGISAAAGRENVCRQPRALPRNLRPTPRVRGCVKCEMAVDLPIPLLPPAIATAREALLPYADRARQLRRCARFHPRFAHARLR